MCVLITLLISVTPKECPGETYVLTSVYRETRVTLIYIVGICEERNFHSFLA
jgi:hypothetical protein